MSERHCPLCNAKDIYLSNIIPTESIACIYKRSIGVDIDDDIKGIPVVRRYICKACGLIFFSPAIVGSDIFYSKLQEYEWYYMKDKVEFSIAADNIKMGDTVLEVGCGQGFFQKKIPGRRYIGLEASASAIDRAEEGDGQIFKETVESHAKTNAGVYDTVVSFQVLEHVADPASFLDGCVHCLKPGGNLIISVPSADSFVSMVINHALNLPPHHVTWWPDRTLKSLEGLFPISLNTIFHEPLQSYHYQYYARTISVALARVLVGAKADAVVDLSALQDEAERLADNLDKAAINVLTDYRLRPHGHTVLAVYQKLA